MQTALVIGIFQKYNYSKYMKLGIPYYSQFLDVEDQYWMPRACGFACMKMIYDYFDVKGEDITQLAEKALNNDGYGSSGLVHDYVVEEFKRAGLSAYRREGMDAGEGVGELEAALRAGNPVIVSGDKIIFGQHKFHMVVLSGLKEKEDIEGAPELEGFYIHDPENLSHEKGKHIYVSLHDFLTSWRGKAIFVSRK
jgi:hypothetical protein